MRALIVGAGIAGPVTAMALQQVGIEPVIVEAHARGDAEVGSYLTVTPNGLDALAAGRAVDDAVWIAPLGGGRPARSPRGERPPAPPQRHARRRVADPRRPAPRHAARRRD